jgi:nitroreductase
MEFTKIMTERRAVNFFDPMKPVSDEALRKIVETAALAPSGFNFQPWQLIVIKSPADKERLKMDLRRTAGRPEQVDSDTC